MFGQLGLGERNDGTHRRADQQYGGLCKPELVLVLQHIKVAQVACGRCHTLARTSEGCVYRFAAAATTAAAAAIAAAATASEALGASHSPAQRLWPDVAVAFSWGKGTQGRLGHGNTFSQLQPTKVSSLASRVCTWCAHLLQICQCTSANARARTHTCCPLCRCAQTLTARPVPHRSHCPQRRPTAVAMAAADCWICRFCCLGTNRVCLTRLCCTLLCYGSLCVYLYAHAHVRVCVCVCV